MKEIMQELRALDNKVKIETQYDMILEGIRAIRRATRWFLRNRRTHLDIEANVERFSKPIAILFDRLAKLVHGKDKKQIEKSKTKLIAENVPTGLAEKMADAPPLYHALNIAEVALNHKSMDVYRVAKIYFVLAEHLGLFWFRGKIDSFPIDGHWSVLGKASLKADMDQIQRALTLSVISFKTPTKTVATRLNQWFRCYQKPIKRWHSILTKLRRGNPRDYTQLSVAVRELSHLVGVVYPKNKII